VALNLSDKELFKKIIKGNEQAFDALFKRYYSALCRFAVLFAKKEDDAEEIVQFFFVKIWNNRKKIKITSSVKSYLYTSVRNASLNFIQKEKTRDAYEEKYGDHAPEISENPIPDEFNEIYNNAVEKLPERTKEVFILCKNEGLTYSEIAEYLQISAKTVENNMGIAFRKLREFLMPYKHLVYRL